MESSCASPGVSLHSTRARAIKYRQENQEAVGGFFSQIGELYVVHHLWGKRAHLTHPTLAVPPPFAPQTPYTIPQGQRGGGRGVRNEVSPLQPTRTCSPVRRRGTRRGGSGAGMRMSTTRVSTRGWGCPCWQSCEVTPRPLCPAVPLIRTMESRIMIPLKISPLQ